MVWDTCKIVLHNPTDGLFHTNSIVTGTVVLEVKQVRKVGQIDLKVKGTGKAGWSRPSPTMPYIKIYAEKKEVFCMIIDIFQDLRGKTIKPGIISRQFHFFLPSDLPPSYHDTIAKIHYRVQIQSKNAYGLTKQVVCPFNIVNPLDLNHLNEYKIPLLYEMSKKISVFGNFFLLFKTYKGFVAKQLIPFEAIIKSKHKFLIKRLQVCLIKKIEYNITEGYYNAEESISKSVYSDVLYTYNQSCYFNMQIPEVTPSTINHENSMINISYSLRVKVCFVFHFPLEIEIPVTIATVPIAYKS